MRTVRTVAELRAELAPARPAGDRIGLVPTMGDFHDGHLALIRRARADCDVVVVSLFVNPTQFGPSEDLDTYPRDETRDDALAAAEGVDVLFAPAPEEVYPPGFQTSVEVTELTGVLEGDDGARGRGHLRGVATVCAKLFNMVAPDVAYFGQKDAQQVLVVRRLVRDLDMPLTIEVLPTVREADGLAMSSRNANLSPEERARATALARALRASETAVAPARASARPCWDRRAPYSPRRRSSPTTSSCARPSTSRPSIGSRTPRCWRSRPASSARG